MKRPVVWVTVTLTVAIFVTATLLIATTTRGQPSLLGSPARMLDSRTGWSVLDRPSR